MNSNKNIIKAEKDEQSLYQDVCVIIDQAQAFAYRAVDEALIKRNWLLGMRIHHEVSGESTESLYDNIFHARGESMNHLNILNSLRSQSPLSLFAAKYLTYMPTKEELRREIEQQKEFFRLQQQERGGK